MIVHVRSIEVALGKYDDAIAWAKELNAYAASKDLGQFALLRPQFGTEIHRLSFVWEFESLAAYEVWDQAVHADEGVRERIKMMSELFIPGSNAIQSYVKVENPDAHGKT